MNSKKLKVILLIFIATGGRQIIQTMAGIHPFVNASADVSIVVCSDDCKTKLVSYKDIEQALLAMILHIAISYGEEVNEEFKKLLSIEC